MRCRPTYLCNAHGRHAWSAIAAASFGVMFVWVTYGQWPWTRRSKGEYLFIADIELLLRSGPFLGMAVGLAVIVLCRRNVHWMSRWLAMGCLVGLTAYRQTHYWLRAFMESVPMAYFGP